MVILKIYETNVQQSVSKQSLESDAFSFPKNSNKPMKQNEERGGGGETDESMNQKVPQACISCSHSGSLSRFVSLFVDCEIFRSRL